MILRTCFLTLLLATSPMVAFSQSGQSYQGTMTQWENYNHK